MKPNTKPVTWATIVSGISTLVCVNVGGTAAEATPVKVFGAKFEVAVGVPSKLFQFNENGAFEQRWDIPESRHVTSITTDGKSLFVGQYAGGGAGAINGYSTDGSFLGQFADVSTMAGPSPNFPRLETDAKGSVYVAYTGQSSQPRTSFRLNPNGTISAEFAHPDLVFPNGIDATSDGDVYIVNGASVGVGDRLFKFTADGTFIADFPISGTQHPADIAINEKNDELYIADSLGESVEVYDLSSGTPIFSDTLSLPANVADVFVEPTSGRIFGVYYDTVIDDQGFFLKYTGFEVTRDGDIAALYVVDAVPRGQNVHSIVAVAVPEPASNLLLLLAGCHCWLVQSRGMCPRSAGAHRSLPRRRD